MIDVEDSEHEEAAPSVNFSGQAALLGPEGWEGEGILVDVS